MATWQFDAYFLPRAKLVALFGEIPERISPAQFESVAWWDGTELPPNHRQLLSNVLTERESWSSELRTWGDQDGNRIDLGYDGEALDEVRVRFDLRYRDMGFIEAVARLAQVADCWLVTEELEAIPPVLEKLLAELNNSRARRFIVDPQAFLDEGHPDT